MRNYIRNVIYLIVIVGFSFARAGSYEDWFSAIKQDNPAAVLSLLQRGFDPNSLSPDGQHGLYLALRDGSVNVSELLVDWPKTQVEWRTPKDESPLMMAALKGHADLVRKLIARGADVNNRVDALALRGHERTPGHHCHAAGAPRVHRCHRPTRPRRS